MRNPPDRNRKPSPNSSPDNTASRSRQGGRRARTIRDMFVDEPLRRLTNVPALKRRPAAGPRGRQNNPPDLYDLEQYGDAGSSGSHRPRWTEPGTWLRDQKERQGSPDQTDPRRSNRRPAPDPQRDPAGAPRGADQPWSAAAVQRANANSGDASGAAADMRWNRPDWLGQAPMPADAPPLDPAPPTTPRYGPTYGPTYGSGDAETPQYQPDERDPNRQQTDYRATSVRAALWASRTPSYQPDQPPELAQRDVKEEQAYFESYDTRRAPASLAHAGLASGQAGSYSPGAVSEVDRLRQEAQVRGRTDGPAPYFWEMAQKPRQATPLAVAAFWLVSLLLIGSALLTSAYAGVSIYAASQLVYAPQVMPKGTPADAGLAYKDVEFTSRTDHLMLRGWFIPGVVSPGHLTTSKTIIMVHGIRANRADPGAGLLNLSEAVAKRGFAVLAFDLRGSGDSSSAPTSLGYFEQRDVLGAVDFLKSGAMPYPELGRPKVIGGWGVSMGAATLLMAAAQEPSLRAIVSDSAYADVTPILQREIPLRSHLPGAFTPGILEAAQAMYGVDFYADKPAALVARIAPRPILFIHGAADTYIPPSNMTTLAQAAQATSGAHVQTWLVPKATHAQAYHVAGQSYVDRVVAFFAANLSAS